MARKDTKKQYSCKIQNW